MAGMRQTAKRVRRWAQLEARVAELEAEVQECRQVNLRLAELTDVVAELLLPVAQRDEARIGEVLRRYDASVGVPPR
jgi:flagellar biosynthesis/type III secretory pathway chaperone